jgi:hypothetical protein
MALIARFITLLLGLLGMWPLALTADYRAAPQLDLLQRIQGDWVRHCYAGVDGIKKVYREDRLIVNFTHLNIVSRLYFDDECKDQSTSYSAKFRYIVPGEYFNQEGLKIFSLNLQPEGLIPSIVNFPLLNIVAVDAGRLFFGRDFSGESAVNLRLTRLEQQAPFLRQ